MKNSEKVNRLGALTITEMEDLKIPAEYAFSGSMASEYNKGIDECIKIIKRRFTGWTE